MDKMVGFVSLKSQVRVILVKQSANSKLLNICVLLCFFFLGAFTCLVFLTTANKCIIHVYEGCRDFIIQ